MLHDVIYLLTGNNKIENFKKLNLEKCLKLGRFIDILLPFKA